MKQLTKSFERAIKGILTTWREEANFRIELLAGIGILLLAKYLEFSMIEWIIVIVCIGAVLAAEMANTAIEDLCDRVEPSYDPIIGKIKDVMGGFVLVVALASASVGIIIFSSHV